MHCVQFLRQDCLMALLLLLLGVTVWQMQLKQQVSPGRHNASSSSSMGCNLPAALCFGIRHWTGRGCQAVAVLLLVRCSSRRQLLLHLSCMQAALNSSSSSRR
jgi:hypothetical protein